MYLSQQKVEIMHSDNGAEFKDKFESACLALGIIKPTPDPGLPPTTLVWKDSTEPFKKNG